MGKGKSLSSIFRFRLTSADIPGALRRLADSEIFLYDVVWEDDLSVLLTVSRKQWYKTQLILEKRGDRCEAVGQTGLYWQLLAIKRRWLLLAGILLLFALTLWIPSRIWFYEVSGNQYLANRHILTIAQDSGLTFGCRRSVIKSEKTKNSMLEKIPELDWVGITTAGCVATIEVREKPKEEKSDNKTFGVSHITAVCDGVVDSVTVTSGVALCKPGQAVNSGQILISGYEDCGLLIRAMQAEGEVYAKTMRTVTLISSTNERQRGQISASEKKYSLQIGKNLINFSKDSGISPPGCVKMYSRKYLTLPGGFRLPVALISEETVSYETVPANGCEEDHQWLEESAEQYVLSLMNAGEILLQQTALQCESEICMLTGIYACREQIGKTMIEEILSNNGKYSGTDR